MYRKRSLITALMAFQVLILVAGCSGQSNETGVQGADSTAENSTSNQSLTNEPDASDASDDSPGDSLLDLLLNDEQKDDEQKDDGLTQNELSGHELPGLDQFDIAEFFFTEADRQWFCSVTTSVSVFTDQFFMARLGEAWFERFGLVEWSRNDVLDQLEIEIGVGRRFSLREIFATNTILEFQLYSENSEASEMYECVLTTRDLAIL